MHIYTAPIRQNIRVQSLKILTIDLRLFLGMINALRKKTLQSDIIYSRLAARATASHDSTDRFAVGMDRVTRRHWRRDDTIWRRDDTIRRCSTVLHFRGRRFVVVHDDRCRGDDVVD